MPRSSQTAAALEEIGQLLESTAVSDPRDELDRSINAMLTRVAARVRALTPEDLGVTGDRSSVFRAVAATISDDALRKPECFHAMLGIADRLRRAAGKPGGAS